MQVKVRSIAYVKQLLGNGELLVTLPDGATVADLLTHLVETCDAQLAVLFAEPKDKSAHAPLRVMVNGRDITVLSGRSLPLAEGDDVLVFVPIAGG